MIPLIIAGLTAAASIYSAKKQNAANAQQAQKQMDFQREQTGSSYQRGVADMQAAGLNPMLAYSQGGAQSGAGAQAPMAEEIGKGATTALSAMHSLQELENMSSTNEQIQATVDLTKAEKRHTDMKILTEIERPEEVKMSAHGKWSEASHTGVKQYGDVMRNNILDSTLESQKSAVHSGAKAAEYEARHKKYDLSEAKAGSEFYDTIGSAGKYLKGGGEILNGAKALLQGKPTVNYIRNIRRGP